MKKTYMDRLACWARWKLPRQEAESVIADYREIVGTPPRSEEELLRDVGAPRDAVERLANPEKYRLWLAAFFLFSLCALAPCLSSPSSLWWFRYLDAVCAVLSVAGSAAVVLWFRRFGKKEQRMPKALPIVLAVFFVWCGGILLFDWSWMHDPAGFVRMTEPLTPYIGGMVGGACRVSAIAAALACVWSLVKARTGDRRWAAVYILSLAVVLVAMETRMLTSTLSDFSAGWYVPFLRRYCAIFAVSLVGAGAALC